MNESTPLVGARNLKAPSPWYPIMTMILVAFSGGALFAPHVQFYTEIFCYIHYTENSIPIQDCSIPPVQKMVSRAQAIIMFLTYASTLISAGYYGRLSDRKGRTLILRISTLGSLFYVTCDLLTAKYYKSIGISLLFLGPLVRGLLVGESVLMAAVQAYIADCTLADSRTVVFARLMASLFIGSAIGPFVSSLILKHTGSLVYVFYVAFLVDLVNVIYTTSFIPESFDLNRLQDQQRAPISFWQKLNVFSALGIIVRTQPASMAPYALVWIALADFLLTLVRRPPTLIYAMLKFKWTAYEGSLYYTCASLMKLLIMIGVLPFLSSLFKKGRTIASFDIWMMRIGIGIDAICLALAGIATNVMVFTIAGMLQSFSMLAQPSIRGLITMMVNRSQVGELLGAIAILDSVASILAHLGINTLYGSTVSVMPNLTFFVCAFIASCSCLAAFLVKRSTSSLNNGIGFP